MRLYDLKSFYIITDIKEHKENKDRLLSLIDSMEESRLDNISKTDWNLPRETKREYKDLFYKINMLDNYTNHKWFLDLNVNKLIKLY